MRVLAVNAGSSSLKLSVVDGDDRIVAWSETGADSDPSRTLSDFIGRIGDVGAVAHRLVHGGPDIRRATLVDEDVRRRLESAVPLAPTHAPIALTLLDAARRLTGVPHVVCVDTAFHTTLPPHASTYAIPSEWRELGIRRYGFHGLSYAWASGRAAALLGRSSLDLQLVMAHIGSGVSVCATRDGSSVDTSMGFTPLEGAVMSHRSGSVDPGAMLWLQQLHGVSPAEMNDALEQRSGLVALCGTGDVREVERRAGAGDLACAAALDVYIHSLRRSIAAVAASLERIDALVFTGGVGEHSRVVRSRLCAGLASLGIPGSPGPADGDTVVAAAPGRPSVVVVTAREDAEMARETRELLATA